MTQICEAFPKEISTIVPKKIKELNESLDDWKDYFRQLNEQDYDEATKTFIKQVVKQFYFPKEDFEQLHKLQSLQKFNKDLKAGKRPSITEEDIIACKRIPIETLYQFEVVKTGRARITVKCPFHADKFPSFVIYRETNTCHCFSCKFSADSIGLIMETEGLNFVEAMKQLKAGL